MSMFVFVVLCTRMDVCKCKNNDHFLGYLLLNNFHCIVEYRLHLFKENDAGFVVLICNISSVRVFGFLTPICIAS